MKSNALILFFLSLGIISFAQNLSGRWQSQTSEISDSYLGNYLFADSTFIYTINGYDGLNPIQVLGGIYSTKFDTLFFTVLYIKRMEGGKLERSEIYTQNDSWAFENGKITTESLNPPVHAVATFRLQNEILWIDERKFYKIHETEDVNE
jgi:hypothetical protein